MLFSYFNKLHFPILFHFRLNKNFSLGAKTNNSGTELGQDRHDAFSPVPGDLFGLCLCVRLELNKAEYTILRPCWLGTFSPPNNCIKEKLWFSAAAFSLSLCVDIEVRPRQENQDSQAEDVGTGCDGWRAAATCRSQFATWNTLLLSSIKLSAAGQLRFTLTPNNWWTAPQLPQRGKPDRDYRIRSDGPTACCLDEFIIRSSRALSTNYTSVRLFVLALHKTIFTHHCPAQLDRTRSQFNFMSDDNSLARLLVGGKNILWRISISFALRLAKRNSLENNALPAKLFTKIGLSLLLGTGKNVFNLDQLNV